MTVPPFTKIIPDTITINVLDLGSKHVDAELPNYSKLSNFSVFGIDAANANDVTVHAFIGNGKPKKFYNCALPTCSSLFEPNLELMSLYNGLYEWLEVQSVEKVDTSKLNDFNLPF